MVSKRSRVILKEIVKECIVEIMHESFFSNVSNSEMQERLFESNNQKQRTQSESVDLNKNHFIENTADNSKKHGDRYSYLNNIKFGAKQENGQKKEDIKERVSKVANSMTSDPILAGILEDTALTTLQEQASAERGRSSQMTLSKGDHATRAMSVSEPASVFGEEAASKWAALAFPAGNNKN